jgi:hypothetical protein
MSSNGDLPSSALSPIAGGGQLADDAAAAWNALAAHVKEKEGWSLRASEAYRTLARQWYFWNLYQSGRGNLAAYPGTSNHGWGLAVDLATYTDRNYIDKYGAQFGWSKSWSDAPGEWWHIKYQPGHYSGPDPGPDYKAGPNKPSWWDKVKRKLRDARHKYAHKKKRRKQSERPKVRERLHAQLKRIRAWIKWAAERLKKNDGWKD